MSVHVVSWARKQKVGDPGTKLVLLILADNADDSGYSYWGQKKLADEAEMGRSTVQKKIAKLVEMGLLDTDIRLRDDGGRTTNGYRLRPAQDRGGGATPEEAAPATPGQAAEPSVESNSTSPSIGWLPQSVGGRSVTDQEREWTDTLLDVFNAETGKRFAGKDWRTMIVRRLREHLDVGLDELTEMVKHQCAHPWWKGDPTPSVIFGNGKTFDMALNRVKGRQGGQRERKFTRD